MTEGKTLFDDGPFETQYPDTSCKTEREDKPLDRLKNLEEKIATAVDRVKALKEEKISSEKKISQLEALLDEKNQEIESLRTEKTSIKSQVQELLDELESLDI
jgi:chromosome segregation ATPase